MLFSLDWLRQYVDLPEEPEAIGRRLTFAGFAIDGIEETRGTMSSSTSTSPPTVPTP